MAKGRKLWRNRNWETQRRRAIQEEYNRENNIVPKTIIKKVHEIIRATISPEEKKSLGLEKDPESMNEKEFMALMKKMDKEMKQAASDLQFEKAAQLRDKIIEFKKARLK